MVVMKTNFITFLDKEKADEISNKLKVGYIVERININGQLQNIYKFIETEDLCKFLQDKSKYSKKDYFCTNIMKFNH